MRTHPLTTILLLGAGLTILAIQGSAHASDPWENASELTPRELFFAASNNAPQYLEYRQALAVAGMAYDQAVDRDNADPFLRDAAMAAFWPIDANGKLWGMVPEHGEMPSGSFITLGESPGMGLSQSRMGLDTWALRDWYLEAEVSSPALMADVPSLVWRARALLRPAQAWELVNGDPKGDMADIYEDLQLAPNPHVLGGLTESFDRVEFFYGNDDDGGRPYRLLLTLGDKAWLWSAGEPSLSEPGFDMRLSRDGQALHTIKGGDGHKPRSMGTLSDLGELLDTPLRLAWLAQSEQVSLDQRRAAWENRAKLTLRAIGSSQLAYQDQNLAKNYASWDDMIETDYIQRGYTRKSMIDNYSLAVFFADNSSTSTARNHFNGSDASFTIVAVPRYQRNQLRTFSICDDQTVRVATDFNLNIIPNRGNSVPVGDDPCTWESVR